MKTKPWVTIITPVAEPHVELLSQAVASVEAQTVLGWQVLIVNDTGRKLPPVRPTDSRIQIVSTEGGTGSAHARNLGVSKATTPFVVFLDADDLLIHTGLEVLVRGFASIPYVSYVYGDHFELTATKEVKYFTTSSYDRVELLKHSLHAVTVLVPKSVVVAAGGFDEQYGGWEDWEFYLRLALNGYCGLKVPSPTIVYRLASSLNRDRHNADGPAQRMTIIRKYADWFEGRKVPMGCCPKDTEAEMSARELMAGLKPVQSGTVLLEYVGPAKGTVPFRGPSGTTYLGARDGINTFIQANPRDVGHLIDTQQWRQAVQASTPTVEPKPHEVALPSTWHRPEPPKREVLAEGASLAAAFTAQPAATFVPVDGEMPPEAPPFTPDAPPPPEPSRHRKAKTPVVGASDAV